jgi:hypothetical protein
MENKPGIHMILYMDEKTANKKLPLKIKGVVFLIALCFVVLSGLGCEIDNLSTYCQDRDGTFHFKGSVPPIKAGDLEKVWGIDQEAVIFEAIPDYTFGDLGDIGPTYILMVSYGNRESESTMENFKSYINSQGYCIEGECEIIEFTLGENSGHEISWRMERGGFLWYSSDFMFKRNSLLYHISIQSIRREKKPEYNLLISSFTPGAPPQESFCIAPINLPNYDPGQVFK